MELAARSRGNGLFRKVNWALHQVFWRVKSNSDKGNSICKNSVRTPAGSGVFIRRASACGCFHCAPTRGWTGLRGQGKKKELGLAAVLFPVTFAAKLLLFVLQVGPQKPRGLLCMKDWLPAIERIVFTQFNLRTAKHSSRDVTCHRY